MRALRRAYESAGVSPARVGLVEAHGTGTVVGDRSEVESAAKVFGEAGAQPRSCALGSVKSLIGHTKCAAGLAGLINATLALYHKVRPPILVDQPNPPDTEIESHFSQTLDVLLEKYDLWHVDNNDGMDDAAYAAPISPSTSSGRTSHKPN